MIPAEFGSSSDLISKLFNRYKYNMQKIAFSILQDTQYAEDAVSESMIKIIKNIGMIDDIDTTRCANFVYTITKNTALDFYRKVKRESELCNANNMFSNVKEDINYDIFESRHGFGEQMRQYMAELTDVDIDIIGLKYGDDFTYKEIGILLNMSEENVRKRASRAKQKLAAIIMEGK